MFYWWTSRKVSTGKPTLKHEGITMEKTYIETWNRLCIEHESCAHTAWSEATTRRSDGTMKSEQEYYEDLIWICEGIISAGGTEGC